MPRYFLEVAYNGQNHSGFQIQKNATSIQGEINHSLEVILKKPIVTYGSSRTDAGVHAHQNFLHVDLDQPIPLERKYNINAILPSTIALNNIFLVSSESHARFDAIARSYKYVIYKKKNPFLKDFGYFFPFPVSIDEMQTIANSLLGKHDFSSFSKRNTQVNNFFCDIKKIQWVEEEDRLLFYVSANRFLRGMVRGLVATMLKVGRGKINRLDFETLFECKKCGIADFSAPAQGLFLERVHYPPNFFS